ncbi:putative pectinesterase [Helianthus annuus]|nr:putative pectinesterase [Helianthus annuus]
MKPTSPYLSRSKRKRFPRSSSNESENSLYILKRNKKKNLKLKKMALEGGKKKKYTVIAIATMLVVAAVVGTIFHVRRSTKEIEIHTEEKTGAVILLAATVVTATTIIILCKYTDFRDICRETLERIKAGIKAPSQLIKASFAHAVERIQFAIDKSSTIRQSEKDPRAVVALDQCKELLGVSIDDLKRSINKLRVWLSGSVTYQETCIDAFDNTTSNSGPAMVKLLDLGSNSHETVLRCLMELLSWLVVSHQLVKYLFLEFRRSRNPQPL